MAHDVFISYSTEDKPTADAACATLEARHIRCWVAPRDVAPGQDYAEALVEAIDESRTMILVFSSNSNDSPHVMREVERAASKGIPILPIRIEDVPPSKSMEYLISRTHWLDALTPPLEKHLRQLAETVNLLLTRAGRPEQVGGETEAPLSAGTAEAAVEGGMERPPPSRRAFEAARRWGHRPVILLALGIGAIVAVTVIVLVALLSGGKEGDSGAGETSVEQALQHVSIGNEFVREGRLEEALEEFDRAIEFDPGYALAYYNRALACYGLGDFERALADYSKAIELQPRNADNYHGRALIYYDQGDFERALTDYDKAIELDPNDANAYHGRGNTYYELGDLGLAIADYSKTIELQPTNADNYYNRAVTNSLLGNTEQAIADVEKALSLTSTTADRTRFEKFLDELRSQ